MVSRNNQTDFKVLLKEMERSSKARCKAAITLRNKHRTTRLEVMNDYFLILQKMYVLQCERRRLMVSYEKLCSINDVLRENIWEILPNCREKSQQPYRFNIPVGETETSITKDETYQRMCFYEINDAEITENISQDNCDRVDGDAARTTSVFPSDPPTKPAGVFPCVDPVGFPPGFP